MATRPFRSCHDSRQRDLDCRSPLSVTLNGSFSASPSQRRAIEAPLGPVLVQAGPGAGKTHCLIERIRHLIGVHQIDPSRIIAFTFTNKAADEIASRLDRGGSVAGVHRGTIHAYCARILRDHGAHVGLRAGFGIADDEYQTSLLSRLNVAPRWQKTFLSQLSLHRFRDVPLQSRDADVAARYTARLLKANMVDFDQLVLLTAGLFELPDIAQQLRAAWDYVLVDEFQDLNMAQYRVVTGLAAEHRNIFAVGDDEQSIYSWTGADPRLFLTFSNHFGIANRIALEENHRCPENVVGPARRLVRLNAPLFDTHKTVTPLRSSVHAVQLHVFANDDNERRWLVNDLQRDRSEHGLAWREVAILYRQHTSAHPIEGDLIRAGIPCRSVAGRALADDSVVRHVVAALRVISYPADRIYQDAFLRESIPGPLLNTLNVEATATGESLVTVANRRASRSQPNDPDRPHLFRASYALHNLSGLGAQHTQLNPLIEELLSHRIGPTRTKLEQHHDELSDPSDIPEVVQLAQQLTEALSTQRRVQFDVPGPSRIPLRGMLGAAGMRQLLVDSTDHQPALVISDSDAAPFGLPLTLFKALQLIAARDFVDVFRDFTAIDLETTGKRVTDAGIVEIGAVRVRDGQPVEEFYSLVNPEMAIEAGAAEVHGYTDADVRDCRTFAQLWPELKAFIGTDVLIAHNGYQFDFPILRRMIRETGDAQVLSTYDTLPLARDLHPGSRKLEDLAKEFHIASGRAHHASDDTYTLVHVVGALGALKVKRARKTALAHLMDYLGVALALSDATHPEAVLFAEWSKVNALGRYSQSLDHYDAARARDGDPDLPTLEELIHLLGGRSLMAKLRIEKNAEERYPVELSRLRRLIDPSSAPLTEQIGTLLERIALSRHEGPESDVELDRVSLLTMHATKGLEFSRVYIIGAADADMLNGSPDRWTVEELEEARRLLYVGMTRTRDRLVLTRVDQRGEKDTTAQTFLDEMQLEEVRHDTLTV